MSKRKLTAEDKKTALLDYFHETRDVFQLKELEKMAPRATGIPQQAIKDILQKLMDDGLVDTCKVGSSVLYWSYPGRSKDEKLVKLGKLQNQLMELDEQIEKCKNELKTRNEENEDPEAANIQNKIDELKVKHTTLLQELGNYEENDGCENWEKMRDDTKSLHEAANRWTDNVFCIKSWCKKKFNIEESRLDKQFRIPGDFDYIE
uniref:Meiotic nuclear division protein 1 homolog n=1 Tax=Culicoides sonorensis TaxID=179676 RepID=A0A336L506_CULSO